MFNSSKSYTSLKVNAGDSLDTPAQKKRRKIRVVAVIVFLSAVALTMAAFAIRFLWHKLYITNERLVFRQIIFKDTRHYSAIPTDGHADILNLLAQEGIQAGKTNLLQIDLNTVQAILKQQPLLTNIKITKILPDTLQIEAREHSPEAILCLRTQQGGRRRLPIALCPFDPNSKSPQPIIVLPQELKLYSERENAYKSWNYAVHPQPFNNKVSDSVLPLLFDFNFVNAAITPGTVITDKNLAAAIKIIHACGITSTNRHFNIQHRQYIAPNTLRLTVTPMNPRSKIQSLAAIDMDCNRISDDLFTKLYQFLDMAESNASTTSIRYLNATGNSFYSSPNPAK